MPPSSVNPGQRGSRAAGSTVGASEGRKAAIVAANRVIGTTEAMVHHAANLASGHRPFVQAGPRDAFLRDAPGVTSSGRNEAHWTHLARSGLDARTRRASVLATCSRRSAAGPRSARAASSIGATRSARARSAGSSAATRASACTGPAARVPTRRSRRSAEVSTSSARINARASGRLFARSTAADHRRRKQERKRHENRL